MQQANERIDLTLYNNLSEILASQEICKRREMFISISKEMLNDAMKKL